jgi:hypothetical protein
MTDAEAGVEELVLEMNRLINKVAGSTAGGASRFKSLVAFFQARLGPLFVRAAQRQR